MLERTRSLGEMVMMLQVITSEMIKFFSTFGLLIFVYLVMGGILGYAIVHDL